MADASYKPADGRRKPPWLRVKAFGGKAFNDMNGLLKDHGLFTVCQEANCPNRGECFTRGTATFLILGPLCTRNCRFCNVSPGKPLSPNPDEPRLVAEAVKKMKLRHAVVTSVTRDDLADGGASQFAQTVQEIRRLQPICTIEILTPDFQGDEGALAIALASRPTIFNHNVETVPELYATVRPAAVYQRSLDVLRFAHERFQLPVKSGLMVGLGETSEQLNRTFRDLARHHVSLLTIGQYLQPTPAHLPVVAYLPPEEFDRLAEQARRAGIRQVFAGPLVRSSYLADAMAQAI